MKTENEVRPMDERQTQIIHKSVAWGFGFLILCLLIATIYKIATTGNAGWELFAIIGAAAVVLIARRKLGDMEQPLDWKNRPLPLGNSKKEKRIRRKNYAVGSAIFGLTFAAMDVLLICFGESDNSDYALAETLFPNLSSTATIALTAVIAFVTMGTISMIFDYLIGERKVKRYNQMLQALDEE